MLFNSFPFLLLFLPAVLAFSLKLKGQPLLRFIGLASVVFYAFAGHVWFIIPMLFTTCLDFMMAPLIAATLNPSRKKTFLLISVTANLGLLFYFKYSGLMLHTAELAASYFGGWNGSLDTFQVILPAGISFYTFQTLSYIIDVYRGQADPERNFWRFVCFVTFFPHLVAGPLTRHDQLIPQLSHMAEVGVKPRWEHGIYLFCIGLAKKVLIGDRIAAFVHPLIGAPEHMTMATAWLALLGFTLQIYFDFSGYSDMAIGLGRLFGIELPQNFNSPYKATSPVDFWRRWHITLSRWLRDYLYITLGGNCCSNARRNVNVMVTMILGGLWHGASWTFAVWGCYHGLLLVVFYRIEHLWIRLPVWIQRAATFVLVMIGWLFFRAASWDEATLWFTRLFDVSQVWGAFTQSDIKLAGIGVLGMALVQLCPNASSHLDLGALRPVTKIALGVMTLASILALNYSSRFLYFQF